MSQTDTTIDAANTDDQSPTTTAGESEEEIRNAWTDYAFEGQPKFSVEDLDVYYGDDQALQQPVAADLRFVAASFKIITDLERVADLATNLGEYALGVEHDAPVGIDVSGIGEATHGQVEAAMAAYATDDAGAARRIVADDDDVDAMCASASDRIVRDLIEREADGGDGWSVERLMDDVSRLLLTIRDVERVGDHAVNIAARTLYMVENDDELIY